MLNLSQQRLVAALCTLAACGPSPATGSVSTGAQTSSDVSSSSLPGSTDTGTAQTSTATSLSTGAGTEEAGASSSSSTGFPAHCVPKDDVVEFDVTLEALDADPNIFTTSTRETCTVTATSRNGTELDCPEVGAVELSYAGPEGLDLRQLPEQVLLDMEKTDMGLGPVWLRLSLSTTDLSLLVAYTNTDDKTRFGVADNPWLAPLWVGRRVLDCPPYDEGGSQCTLSRIEVNAPRGSVTAVQSEQVDVPGGWLMVLSVALECDTHEGAASPVEFGIIHESVMQ